MQLQEQVAKEMKKASEQMSFKLEQHINLRLQPKPKRLPNRIYKWILKKLLVLEYFK